MFNIVFIGLILVLNGYVIAATWNHFGVGNVGIAWRIFLLTMPLWEIVTFFIMSYQFRPDYGKASWLSNLGMGLSMAFLVGKLLLITFLLLNDTYRILRWPIENTLSKEPVSLESRRRFLTNIGLVTASIPFAGLIYGTLKGKYNYKTWNHSLAFDDLPQAFSGLRIAQLSDIHAGSFDSIDAVKEGLEKLMAEQPDIILLTGDLVNNFASEIDDYVPVFRDTLKAPMGKYAVMGNHDYGEYANWKSEEDKEANIKAIRERYAKIGFTVLDNEFIELEKDGSTISLIGVENWGGGHFPKYGDFDKASENVDPNSFKILMSHDPDHWDQHIIDHEQHVHLTLSGHTHGSQMGVEIPGFVRWSPVQYRYKRWAGLYEEKNQYLYINRGFGFIGYPGRVGIWPEITILDLVRS